MSEYWPDGKPMTKSKRMSDERVAEEEWPHPRAWCRCSVCKSDYRPKRPEDGCPYCKHSELVDGLKWLVFKWDEPGEWADDTWHHGNMATLTECAATLRALLEQEARDD